MTLTTALWLAAGYWLVCIVFLCLCKKILP